MMSQDLLKKLGVFGVSVGLLASPMAFADMHQAPEEDPAAGDPATTQPADPATQPTDPATAPPADPMSDPGAPSEPGVPAGDSTTGEPGFGSGTEPMPQGEGEGGPQPADPGQPDGDDDWEKTED